MTTPAEEVTTDAPLEQTPEERIEALLTRKAEEPEDEEPEGDPETEEESAEPEAPQEEFDEVELEGKTYQVPKEIKRAVLREKDYTQKTQEVAEERRRLAEERQIFEMNRQLETVIADDTAELRQLSSQISLYEQAINQAIQEQDPARVATLNAQYTILQRQIGEKSAEVNQKRNQLMQLVQYEKQQRLQKGYEEVSKRIKGFSPETAKELRAAAKEFGYADYELNDVDDPRALQVLWEAAQYRKLQAAKPNIQKRVAEAPKTLKPKANQAPQNNTKTLEQRVKKSGRMEDAAELLFRRMQKR